MNTFMKAALLGSLLVAMTGSAMAEQYDLKEVSDSRQLDVNIEIPKMVGITQPNDINLRFNGSESVEGNSHFCVFSNVGSEVNLTVTNTYTGDYGKRFVEPGSFILTRGDFSRTPGNYVMGEHDVLPFKVFYAADNDKPVELTNLAPKRVTGSKWVKECRSNPGQGSQLIVNVDKAFAEDVYHGHYSSTMTLLVSPE